MQRTPAVAISLLLLAAAGAIPAAAHDHRPPRASIHTTEANKKGWPYSEAWTRRADERTCVAGFGHGPPTFRRAVEHDADERLVIRLRKPAPPLEIEVVRWPAMDRYRTAKGKPESLPWTLRPHVVAGEIRAWEVVLSPLEGRRALLGVDAYWRDEEGCGGPVDLGSQSASWTFHVRLR